MDEHILIAAVGGLIYNVLQLLELQRKPRDERPDLKDFFYWLPFLVWPLLGGFLAYVYETPSTPLNKILSLHIGIASPLIIRQMCHVLPIIPTRLPLKDENQ